MPRAFSPEHRKEGNEGVSRRDRETPVDVSDVLLATSNDEGERVEHPFHGSSTGSNFTVDEGGETWRCWRHDCTGNALHLVGSSRT